MMMRTIGRNKSGFTLIEIIITMAIVGIFLAGVFSFFQYNLNIFNLGKDQSNVQSNIRAVSTTITEQVRYAAEVKILTATELNVVLANTIEAYVNYVYYDAGHIHILNRSKHSQYFVGDGGGIEFSASSSGNVLDFIVTGSENNRQYHYDAEVKPLNLGYRNKTINILGSSQQAIMFRTPADFMAIDTRPTVSGVTYDVDTGVVTVDFGVNLTAAVKVSDNDGTSTVVTLLPSNTSVEIAVSPTAVTGRRIAFDVTAASDGNVFTFALTYDTTNSWEIE